MGEPLFRFESKKAGQAAAFVLKRAGGQHTKGHLVKMLYGADRRQMRRTGIPITGDYAVSMPHGPVLSTILNILDGKRKNSYWNAHLSTATADTHKVHLLAEADEDLLSENEKEALTFACDYFRNMTWEEVKEAAHDPKIFSEWKDPKGSSIPISHEEILKHVEKSDDQIQALKDFQTEEALLAKIFA